MKTKFRFQYLAIVILFVLAGYFAISSALFINKSELVKAKITRVAFIEVSDSDSTDWYSLDMQIISSSSPGKKINGYYFETGLTDPEFKAGQTVELYYDTKDPMNSEIKNFWVQWGPPILIGLIFIFYILVMSVLQVVIKKKNKERKIGISE